MKRTPLRRYTPLSRNKKPIKRTPLRAQRKPIKKKSGKPTRTTKDGRMILSDTDWAKKRPEIFARDKGVCQITGIMLMPDCYAIDHIERRKMGGGFRTDIDSNLRLTHPIANNLREQGKSINQIKAVFRKMGFKIPLTR